MINKKVKLNNPTPYPSGSKTKPNPTLGKSTPVPQQVHQHSQDEPTEESPPDTPTQTLVNKCLADSGIDPTDIQNVLSVFQAKWNMPSHETPRQIQSHQRYVFAEVHQTNHQLIDRGANEYIAVYVDDLAIYMKDPTPFCDKLREIAFFIYHLGCGHTRNEDNTTNTLSQHLKYASMW